MLKTRQRALPLPGWTVISLRPRGQHASARAAATRRQAQLLALSPIAIAARTDAATLQLLGRALNADRVVFTSPNATQCAAKLVPLRALDGQVWLAVGAGTQRVLRHYGITAMAPTRMDSEGLLDLAPLHALANTCVGLITAPGGRGALLPALQARGAQVIRANVYARKPLRITPRAVQRLQAVLLQPQRVVLALSSGEALQGLLTQLSVATQRRMQHIAVIAASERLAQLARSSGFRRVAVAQDARITSLLDAASAAFV